nr:MAG TPA: hypothetical protein [Bacteriophage sp.]
MGQPRRVAPVLFPLGPLQFTPCGQKYFTKLTQTRAHTAQNLLRLIIKQQLKPGQFPVILKMLNCLNRSIVKISNDFESQILSTQTNLQVNVFRRVVILFDFRSFSLLSGHGDFLPKKGGGLQKQRRFHFPQMSKRGWWRLGGNHQKVPAPTDHAALSRSGSHFNALTVRVLITRQFEHVHTHSAVRLLHDKASGSGASDLNVLISSFAKRLLHRSTISVVRQTLSCVSARGDVPGATSRSAKSELVHQRIILTSGCIINETNLLQVHSHLLTIRGNNVLLEVHLVAIGEKLSAELHALRLCTTTQILSRNNRLTAGNGDLERAVLTLLYPRPVPLSGLTSGTEQTNAAILLRLRPLQIPDGHVVLKGLKISSHFTRLSDQSDHAIGHALNLVLVDSLLQGNRRIFTHNADVLPVVGEKAILADLRIIEVGDIHLHIGQGVNIFRITQITWHCANLLKLDLLSPDR